MSDYRVSLDVYNGPLDLLLFLIRRDEVDIYDVPISKVMEQYLAYVELLRKIEPELIGDFLVMAATLMEIKSRMLLPRPPVDEAEEEEWIDPRSELVRQLLQYKKFKDAARSLEGAAVEQALRHPRRPAAPPSDSGEIELDNLEIWDLFEAFNRLLEQTGRKLAVHEVSVDDTPIELHEEDLLDAVGRAGGTLKFYDVFKDRTRGEMIGLFLALLELIRRRRLRVSQDDPSEPIWLHVLEATDAEDEFDLAGGKEDEIVSAGADDNDGNKVGSSSGRHSTEGAADDEPLPNDGPGDDSDDVDPAAAGPLLADEPRTASRVDIPTMEGDRMDGKGDASMPQVPVTPVKILNVETSLAEQTHETQ